MSRRVLDDMARTLRGTQAGFGGPSTLANARAALRAGTPCRRGKFSIRYYTVLSPNAAASVVPVPLRPDQYYVRRVRVRRDQFPRRPT